MEWYIKRKYYTIAYNIHGLGDWDKKLIKKLVGAGKRQRDIHIDRPYYISQPFLKNHYTYMYMIDLLIDSNLIASTVNIIL